MARPPRPSRPWQAILTVSALALVAIPGFALGLMAGIAWEEPGLLASHLLGRTREVIWAGRGEEPSSADPGAAEETALPAVAAAPEPAPVPRPEPSPAREPAPEPEGHFAVQVGAFAESEGAERLAEDLRGKGFPVYVSPGAGADGPRWRVRVGPHPTREQAERAADRLERQEKLPTWVLDEDGAA